MPKLSRERVLNTAMSLADAEGIDALSMRKLGQTLRVEAMSRSAEELACRLSSHPALDRVCYPTLDTHPQVDLARKQMAMGGTVLTMDVAGGKAAAFGCLNRLRLLDISNNLGDSKSLVTHPATTTHRRLASDARAAVGIGDGLVRVSVGLEDIDDLFDDLDQALAGR